MSTAGAEMTTLETMTSPLQPHDVTPSNNNNNNNNGQPGATTLSPPTPATTNTPPSPTTTNTDTKINDAIISTSSSGFGQNPTAAVTSELRPTPNQHGVRDMDLQSRLQWAGPLGTLDSIIKAQRRIKGVIVSIGDGGASTSPPPAGSSGGGSSCRIASEYGEFPFNLAAIKANKRFPDRQPRARDRCEFKVSQTNPPKATSIRIAIPSSEVAGAEKAPGPSHKQVASIPVIGGATSNNNGTAVGGSGGSYLESEASSSMLSGGAEGYSFLTGYSASTPGNSGRELGGTAGSSIGGGGGAGAGFSSGTGLEDLCIGLQGMSPMSGLSPFAQQE